MLSIAVISFNIRLSGRSLYRRPVQFSILNPDLSSVSEFFECIRVSTGTTDDTVKGGLTQF